MTTLSSPFQRFLIATLAVAALSATAQMQAPAATPDPPATGPSSVQPGASAPGAKPPVRRQSASEERAGATMPGEMRPENPVVPQLKLPIGRGATAAAGPASSSIDDGMARCKAIQPGPARSDCLRQARISAPSPAPSR
jgi:hypothetical protein